MIDYLTGLLDWGLDLLGGLDPLALALVLGMFTALETTALIGTVVPGDVLVLLAGSTVDSPGRFALVLAGAAVGTYTGELVGYGMGRMIGPRLRTSRLGQMIGAHRWARTEAYLAGRGAPVLVPIRFVSVLHALAPVVAGMVRMPLPRFAGWAGLGALLWAGSYTAVGTAAGAAYREFGHLGLLVTIVVLAVGGVAVYLRRWWRRRGRTARTGRTEPGAGPGAVAGPRAVASALVSAQRRGQAGAGPRR
jgi:membrane-associated protein